jgi:hypothetical protein
VPKILATLKHLDSLHLEGCTWWSLGEDYQNLLFPPTVACIQANPLLEIHVQNLSLPSSFLSLLPDTLKKMVFTDLSCDWSRTSIMDNLAVTLKREQAAISPTTLRLVKVAGLWFSTMAKLPTSFYARLTTLDVYIVNRGPSEGIEAENHLFNIVHAALIARSPALQDLCIRYRRIDRKRECWLFSEA